MECVPGDKIQLQSRHSIRTLSLAQPLMSKIGVKKDYFSVPYEAILPMNWDKIFTNPTQGDDVDYKVNCVFSKKELDFLIANLKNHCSSLVSDFQGIVSDKTSPSVFTIVRFLRFVSVYGLFFSNGSLLKNLGYDLNFSFNPDTNTQYDLDGLYSSLVSLLNDWITAVGGLDLTCYNSFDSSDFFTISIADSISDVNKLLDYITYYPRFNISFENGASSSFYSQFVNALNRCVLSLSWTFPADTFINFSRLFAYQIVIASLYSNDKVDFIYSAELFRQVVSYLVSLDSLDSVNFNYNGISIPYDYLSCGFLSNLYLFNSTLDYLSDSSYFLICTLFGFGRSLKYQDYFVGSRPTPLAVGDNGISVVDNSVSVIDVTKSLALQRFRNQVVRTGRKMKDYLEGIFNTSPNAPLTEPIFLSHISDSLQNIETENTSDAQQTEPNSVTTNLRGHSDKYAFEFVAERPCIIMGCMSFDVRRCYPHMLSRFNTIVDRFDMFNPYLQYIGDQDIKLYEYDTLLSAYANNFEVPFGYTLRDMQYKQRVDEVSGGFLGDLPAWCFLDYDSSTYFGDQDAPINSFISPEFIRQVNAELDKYFISLTGLGSRSYFHFIVMSDNEVTASRPMAYAPSIL